MTSGIGLFGIVFETRNKKDRKLHKMRRINFFLVLLLISSIACAQKNNVQSAAKAIGLASIANADGSMVSGIKEKYGELEDAKKYIDLALAHPKTANSVKMWYYRGRVYLIIHQQKRKDIDPDAIRIATESLLKCLEEDEKKMLKDSTKVFLMTAAILCFYEGQNKYNDEKYAEAAHLYELVHGCLQYDTGKDLARNNVSEKTIILYKYYSANKLGDDEKAKVHLTKLIEMNYNDPMIYISMSRLMQEEKDTAKALEYVEKGRKRFYDDAVLIREQVDLSIALGKSDELLKRLGSDIEYDPENNALFMVRGTLHQKNGDLDKAAADFKEALEIDPTSFLPNYNLGVMNYNEGVKVMDAAKQIKSNEEYAKEKARAEKIFGEAIPYFEAAHEIDSKDKVVLQSLLRLYVRVGDDAKYAELKKKMGL